MADPIEVGEFIQIPATIAAGDTQNLKPASEYNDMIVKRIYTNAKDFTINFTDGTTVMPIESVTTGDVLKEVTLYCTGADSGVYFTITNDEAEDDLVIVYEAVICYKADPLRTPEGMKVIGGISTNVASNGFVYFEPTDGYLNEEWLIMGVILEANAEIQLFNDPDIYVNNAITGTTQLVGDLELRQPDSTIFYRVKNKDASAKNIGYVGLQTRMPDPEYSAPVA